MKRAATELLVCPRTRAPFDLDAIRTAEDEVVEGFLVSRDERRVYPIVAGIAVLPVALSAHLRHQGNVYRRSPMNDPRLARFLLGRAGTGYVVVPFEEVVGHYRDLAADPPPGYETTPHPEDAALAALAADHLGDRSRRGRGLVVGSGVGRTVFVLCETLARVLGVDRSAACVRRARNIAVTVEDFFLPAPKGSGLKEIPLDLRTLRRDGADFVVADGADLPFADRSLDLVLLQPGDSLGRWDDADRALAEARRVLLPGGLLVWHEALLEALTGTAREALEASETGTRGPFRAARVP